MIVLRNKEYSSKTLQLSRSLKKAGNLISTKIGNIGIDVGNKLSNSLMGPFKKPRLLEDSYRIKPKSNIQINREVISSRNKNKLMRSNPILEAKLKSTKAAIKVENAKDSIRKTSKFIATNPGVAVNKGIEYSIKNPIASTGRVIGTAAPFINPVYAAAPIGSSSMGVEVIAKKMNPYYAKGADKISKKYINSKISKQVEGLVNGVSNYLKGL